MTLSAPGLRNGGCVNFKMPNVTQGYFELEKFEFKQHQNTHEPSHSAEFFFGSRFAKLCAPQLKRIKVGREWMNTRQIEKSGEGGSRGGIFLFDQNASLSVIGGGVGNFPMWNATRAVTIVTRVARLRGGRK